MIEDPPHYLLNVTVAGRQISEQYRTVQDAMTAAANYGKPAGVILLCAPGRQPVEVITYREDGTIEVGADVPDDEDLDEPWTDAEIAENFRRGRVLRQDPGRQIEPE